MIIHNCKEVNGIFWSSFMLSKAHFVYISSIFEGDHKDTAPAYTSSSRTEYWSQQLELSTEVENTQLEKIDAVENTQLLNLFELIATSTQP